MTLRPRRSLLPEKLDPVLRFIPISLQGKTETCEKCERSYVIPWELKYEFEQHPFQSADGRVWVCSGIVIDCPLCGRETTLNFPQGQASERIELFSDEAERDLKAGWRLCAYSFVGIETDHLKPLEHGLRELKMKIAPDLDPDTWVSHATDLFSGDRRDKVLGGRAVSKQQAIDFLADFASLIRTHGHPDFTHVAGGIGRPIPGMAHKRFVQEHKEKVLAAAYISLVDLFISNGFQPEFCFEAVKSAGGATVDEWIERVIRRLGKSVSMLYVSRSSAINLPRMALKGSDVRLEMADLIVFLVARYVHCRSINRDAEIDLSLLGPLHYHFWVGSEFRSFRNAGFPWKKLFGDLSL